MINVQAKCYLVGMSDRAHSGQKGCIYLRSTHQGRGYRQSDMTQSKTLPCKYLSRKKKRKKKICQNLK